MKAACFLFIREHLLDILDAGKEVYLCCGILCVGGENYRMILLQFACEGLCVSHIVELGKAVYIFALSGGNVACKFSIVGFNESLAFLCELYKAAVCAV